MVVARGRNLWFGGDDWFILLDRSLQPHAGQLGVFDAFNEHWSTLPILVFRGLYAVFGISTYWPYLMLLVVVHLAIVVLLWHVMVRSAIDPWLALGFTALVAITGVGLENLTNVWQVPLIAPLALGLRGVAPAARTRPSGPARRVGLAAADHRHDVLGPRHHDARRRGPGRTRAPGLADGACDRGVAGGRVRVVVSRVRTQRARRHRRDAR